MQNHALRGRGHVLLENWCTRGCVRSPTRSCPSRTPCRCAAALGLTVCPLPWLIGTPFTHRFARSPPLHPICRHAAEHPGALLTRSFRLSGADCCAAISPRAATSTPEHFKPQRRGREGLWCVLALLYSFHACTSVGSPVILSWSVVELGSPEYVVPAVY